MKQLFFILFIAFFSDSQGQNWAPFGRMNLPPSCFYEDSLTGSLIIGGNFRVFNDDTVSRVVR